MAIIKNPKDNGNQKLILLVHKNICSLKTSHMIFIHFNTTLVQTYAYITL